MKYLARLAVLGFIVVWFTVLRPVALGGPASYQVVVGTSMEPTLRTGDLVIAQAAPAYAIGDLIAFRVPGTQAGPIVIHRIVGGDAASGYIVKGDNKPAPDPWRPTAADVVGRSWIEVPGGGDWLMTLRRPAVLAAVAAGLAAFWFYLRSGKASPRVTSAEDAAA